MMNANSERALSLSLRIADGHDNRSVNARRFSPGLHVACFVRLNIAGRDGFITFGGETRHAFTDWHTADNLCDVRRKTDLSLQHQHTVFKKVDRTCVCAKAADKFFELRLHAGDNNKSAM